METLFRKHQMFISQVKMDIIREIISLSQVRRLFRY